MKLSVITWLLFIGSMTSFTFATASPIQDKIKIEQIINHYVSSRAFEGTVLIAKSGKPFFQKAYGFADRKESWPLDNNSAFQIASLSKPIAATLVLMLEEQGKLTLEDTLADYFPEFDNAIGKQITIDNLLSHTSGIPNHFVIDGWFNPDFHRNTSEQEFVKIIAKLPPAFPPGSAYLYSNPGYFLLGKIVELITEESYATTIKKSIFDPLNMKQSGVTTGIETIVPYVQAYQWDGQGAYRTQTTKNMALFGAGAAIYTTAEDLYRFDTALYSDKLLSDKNKKRIFDSKHAYAWQIGLVPFSPELQVSVQIADGKFDGYSSMMTRFVDEQHSIILLSNIGISYDLKQQLTFDIATILYNQVPPNRKNDATLNLIKSLFSANFSQTLQSLTADNTQFKLSEESLASLAFELLWSSLAEQSLQLFSFIVSEFPNSSTANQNLQKACRHHLAKSAKSFAEQCS